MGLLFQFGLGACSVPVFRYALERWQADDYECLVFHNGDLSESQNAAYEFLEDPKRAELPVNLHVRKVDIDAPMDDQTRDKWVQALNLTTTASLPVAAVFYPPTMRIEEAFWTAPLEEGNVRQIKDSPARFEINRRLRGGHSAVFLLIEGEDPKANEAADIVMEEVFKHIVENFKLPEEMLDEEGNPFGVGPDVPELKIHMSILRVNKTDPREAFLMANIYGLDDSFREEKRPMVFPFFGQGRVFFPLIGETISKEHLEMACDFLLGDCSCTIKAQNPGADLVFQADWWNLVGGAIVKDEPLPPLEGFSDFTEGRSTGETVQAIKQLAGATGESLEPPKKSNTMLFNALIILLIGGGIIAAISLGLMKKKAQ
jgi:hypothetical protein